MQLGLLLAKGVRIKVEATYWGVRRQLQGQEGLSAAQAWGWVLSNVQVTRPGVCIQELCTPVLVV